MKKNIQKAKNEEYITIKIPVSMVKQYSEAEIVSEKPAKQSAGKLVKKFKTLKKGDEFIFPTALYGNTPFKVLMVSYTVDGNKRTRIVQSQ